ncbi:conserved hypothetical protein [Vibrio phage 249E41-1]|nr:conserved hypothetical protein [Vibrio phage 249E41-1]CAH9015860.1 conserved hypothetical protein [Vibrio phage 193E37-1]
MAKTLPDIPVTPDAWVDLSTESGISAGKSYIINNKSSVWVRLIESDTQPDINDTSGEILANFPESYSAATITAGSLKIWAKARPSGAYTTAVLNLQEI